jgi:flavin-binding protein dodecin
MDGGSRRTDRARHLIPFLTSEETAMADSIYRVTDLVGTSKTSWEDAVKNAVQTASKSLRDLRVGEVTRLDVTIDKGKVTSYRARLNVSFKYEK